ncbi:AraC family transcriptional regulator [Anaerocolumna sp. AGMB13025]|uniref:helix-turn-helix transcriptional regulator n=1 Tax=Anaerocolumna sp. AGMB13025 TaxID=3039116 RepID=UPI00241E15EA|nr:AraC family transcriptional regulator [Anaerocolumna sp. AGMB13025]WFR57391.1 AraC family transcriptional regulator [Anaerocolumna sp. AGMB13025]
MEHIISFLYDENRVNNQFNVELAGISYPDPHYYVEREDSKIYCIEYIMEGEGTVHMDGETIYPIKGDIYLLPGGHHHRYYSSQTNPWKKIWMNVYGPLCDLLIRVYHLEGVILVKDLALLDLFQKFLTVCEEKDLGVTVTFQRCSIIFHEILSRIAMHLYDKPIVKNAAAYKIKEYIDSNIYDKFSIKELADTACLSPSQLNRTFKKEFLQTPYEYILTQKIETAKLLLTNTNISIKQIAYKLSFADEHYFSNCFKERCGVSPKVFASRRTAPNQKTVI